MLKFPLNPNGELVEVIDNLRSEGIDINPDGPWICGGAALRAFSDFPLNTDIDIFFQNSSAYEETLKMLVGKFSQVKKNDLVITFGGGNKTNSADWAYVFGWSNSEIVKKNIESILLSNPINNDIIQLISEEIIKNYTIKNWKEFDYITASPPWWSYLIFFIILIGSQVFIWRRFLINNYSKTSYEKNNKYVTF